MEFRVLVVDDNASEDVMRLLRGNRVLGNEDSIVCTACTSFDEALTKLREERYDLVTLDLKDDNAEADADPDNTELAGQKLYEKIKATRFIPIIFYSAYAYKLHGMEKPFVRVVTRGEVEHLRREVKNVIDTKLPLLIRHLEEELRVYMWESIEQLWPEDEVEPNDIVYLIARRLAHLLQGDVLREFLTQNGAALSDKQVHPIEMYIWPPVSKKSFFFGDVLKRTVNGVAHYFLVLSPSCDLQQTGKAEYVTLGRCTPLKAYKEAQKVVTAVGAGQAVSTIDKGNLKAFMRGGNKDRTKFLPGTHFLPDLVLDLQCLTTVEFSKITSDNSKYEKVASLDRPFAEALQGQLSRYYGRIGTPDLATDLAYERAVEKFRI